MKKQERKALVANPAWGEFRDWVKASCELENGRVADALEDARLEKQQGYRNAFEDVWGMVLAFEKEARHG